MAGVDERVLYHRHILLSVLVGVFVISVVGVCISIIIISPPREEEEEFSGRKNVLFIVIDDLRPALGCYGDEKAVTPNIDQLASKSVLFKNAYTQQAHCASSRTSFLTSRRPDSLHLYDDGSYWRESVGDFMTLPQHLKDHGYETISMGKIFEHGIVSNWTDDFPNSWSEYPFRPLTFDKEMEPACNTTDGKRMNLVCPVDLNDEDVGTLPDIEITQQAVNYLKNRTKGPNKSSPFFLGVGYYKPHIPFKFPSQYLDLYPIESMDVALNNVVPKKLPKISWNPWMDIRQLDDIKNLSINFPYGPLPESYQKLIRQGYYASVSYIDDQVGQLLEALEESGYASQTVVVLLGDSGWALGEHQEWSKYSNFEVALRVPLLVFVPGLTYDTDEKKPFKYIPVMGSMHLKSSAISKTNGNITYSPFSPKYVTEEFVELVDIYPTIAEIIGIAVPPLCKVYSTPFCSEGISFYPLIDHLTFDPWVEFSWKTAAFSQCPRPSLVAQNNSDNPSREHIRFMGYSVRTAHFRYTEWVRFDARNFKPDWPVIISRELYDYRHDPFEINNLCDEDNYANTVIELSRMIKKGWRHAMPPGSFDSPASVGHSRFRSP
ncbi:Iduronate 2-sulfatase, partial [Stegodyphus mimosarum]